MTKVITKNSSFEYPFDRILDTVNENGGCYLSFENCFKNSLEGIFFTSYENKTVIDISIIKRNVDFRFESPNQLIEFYKLYLGLYEEPGVSKEPLLNIILYFWERSENFRNLCDDILKFVENPKNINKYKVIETLPNKLTQNNLREVLRYIIFEHYRPVEVTLYNMYLRESGKLYRTTNPLILYSPSESLPEHGVMFMSNYYKVEVLKLGSEVYLRA